MGRIYINQTFPELQIKKQLILCVRAKGGKNMRGLYNTALTLLIIGGINWGLIGLFNDNLVDALFGSATWITRLVYIVVGASAICSFGLFARTAERDR